MNPESFRFARLKARTCCILALHMEVNLPIVDATNNERPMKDPMIVLKTLCLPFCWFALSPLAQAVSPPPDGGYPGFNAAEGQKALFSLSTGVANTAIGWFSLLGNTDGSYNTAVDAGTLLFNVGDQSTGEGTKNTATGAGALLSNTTGTQNTATGAVALFNNTTGGANTAIGVEALLSNTTGEGNTANGEEVARVSPDLVTLDRDGKPETVRYEAVNAMLLNEFLREHRMVKDQAKTIAELKNEIANLAAIVKDQTTQLQKATAKLESTEAAVRIVANSR
jgi:hypothetical protein